jgi:outer membrane receptor for ferrienterochelin and colicins
MFTRVALIFLLLLPFTAFAQILKGEVIDVRSGEKLAGVSIIGKRAQVVSNQQGYFEMEHTDGDSIHTSAMNYVPQAIAVKNARNFLVVQMVPASHQLQEVVVSGTMRTVQRTESPIPVEVYNARFFKKNPTPGVFEALSTLNGVQPQLNCNICNTGDIHINGMEGPYTMVLIDGMPIISSLSRIYGFSGIPTSLIKRMELVKGPASTLYGSDAVAGLINIITKDAYSAGAFSSDVSITSMGELNADLSTGFHTGKLNGLLGVNLFNYSTRHDVNNDNFTDVTQQKRLSIFNKWDIERKNKLPAAISFRYMTEDRWGGELNWTKQWAGSDSIYGETIKTNRFELVGNYGLTGVGSNMIVDYSYSYHQQESYYGVTAFDATQHLTFAQLRGEKKIKEHQLIWGVPMRYTWYDDNTVITQKDGNNFPSRQWNASAFLQDEWKWNDKALLLLGARYEYNNLQGSVFSPRLAFKWEPVKAHTLRLSAGNGYRVVNLFTEDHAALTGAREVVLANELKPERSWNANVNYAAQWLTKKTFINLDASAFYTYFTNKILPDYTTDPNKIIYDNLDGYAVSKGVSLNLDVVWKKGPKVLVGFTLMDVYSKEADANGEQVKQQQMFAPRFSSNFAASYHIIKWNTSIDLTGKVYGPQKLPVVPNDFRPEYSPWFALVNLQVTRKFGQHWEVYAAAKNLLNFIPKNPILHPDDPFDKAGGKYFDSDGKPRPDTNPYGYTFDPTYSYGSMQGIKGMLGFRFNL